MIEYRDALRLFEDRIVAIGPHEVDLEQAQGGVLAEEVFLPEDLPPFDNSAMDGYAVIASDLAEASEHAPVRLLSLETVGAGEVARERVTPGHCLQIMTGAPLPQGADCVVPVEATQRREDGVWIEKSLPSGENIRYRGSEMKAGDKVLDPGIRIGPVEWGLLASANKRRIRVYRPATVALLMTGNELIEPGEPGRPGAIRNSNGYTLRAACRELGIEPVYLGVAPDHPGEVRKRIEEGCRCDILVTVGGVSMGEFDVVRDLLADESTGFEELFYKLRIRPGKPVRCGRIGETWVFALPGNPVSALVTFHLVVKPAWRKLSGRRDWKTPVWRVRLAREIRSPAPVIHFWRAKLRYDSETGMAEAVPFERSASGMLTTLAGADGFVPVPVEADSLAAGAVVDFIPLV